nr:MAG TPA: large terminase [Caudoviricetes sp.]
MSDKLQFTLKQQKLMSLLKHNKLHRLNLLEGSVRSGKTWISLLLWAVWISTRPVDYAYLMCAKTLQTLKRNCLMLLQELVGEDNFKFSISTKEGRLFGRKILFEGANDAKSENKIRGMTLGGAYCDELTLFPKDFFTMLLSRLSVTGAKLIATTNPDVPTHWLKKDYIDNKKVDMLVLRFLIDDNTTLPADYIRDIKKEYTGVYYERFILGNWVAAEGVIYPQFADNPARYIINTPPDDLIFVSIGGDFGGNGSAHTLNATGFTVGFKNIVTLDEYYRKETISPYQLEDDFCNFIEGVCSRYKCTEVYLDSAEQILIKGVKLAAQRRGLRVNIHNARKGDINKRIIFYNRLIAAGRYKIMENCKHTIEAFQTAIWKPNTTEEKRLDDGSINIDSLDAQEYSTETYMTNIFDAERRL